MRVVLFLLIGTCCRIYCDKFLPYKTNIKGKEFLFYDMTHTEFFSHEIDIWSHELNVSDAYQTSEINFRNGDVVIDIGANIGTFSIYLAKTYPFLKIYSFEPVSGTFENFRKNLQINNISVETVTPVHKAVTKDDKGSPIGVCNYSTGGNSIYHTLGTTEVVESISVAQIFEEYKIKKCRLFKIDCEGCEYEALYNTPDHYFSRIEHFRGEFHEMHETLSRGFDAHKLLDFIRSKIPTALVRLEKYGKGELNEYNRKHQKKRKKNDEKFKSDLKKY